MHGNIGNNDQPVLVLGNKHHQHIDKEDDINLINQDIENIEDDQCQTSESQTFRKTIQSTIHSNSNLVQLGHGHEAPLDQGAGEQLQVDQQR